MSYTDNINGIPAQDTVLRQGIATLRNTVISNTIKPLTVEHNGVYTANPNNGTYGYSPVTVDTGVYTGATAPDNSIGKDGDYYYQLSKTRYGIKSVNYDYLTSSPMRILANEFYVTSPFKLTGIRIHLTTAVNVKYYVLNLDKSIIYESETIQGTTDWNEHTLTTPITLVANQHYIIAANVQDKGTYTQNAYTTWNTEYVIFVQDWYSQTDSISGLRTDTVTCMVDPVLETDNEHVIAEYMKDNDAWVSLSGAPKMILSTLNATDNGTYNAPTGTAYSSVSVDTGIYTGTDTPASTLGKDGDYYYRVTDEHSALKDGTTFSSNSINKFIGFDFEPLVTLHPKILKSYNSNSVTGKFIIRTSSNVIYDSGELTLESGWNSHTVTDGIELVPGTRYILAIEMNATCGRYRSISSTSYSKYIGFKCGRWGSTDYSSSSTDSSDTYSVDMDFETDTERVAAEYIKDNDAWVSISSADAMILTTLSVNNNGTYNAPTGTAYSSVSVNVSSDTPQLPTGYTAIDYAEFPSDGQAGFALGEYKLKAFHIVETKTMPYIVSDGDEHAFAGDGTALELYYDDGKTKVYGNNSTDYLGQRDASVNNIYYHRALVTSDSGRVFNLGYYRINQYEFRGRMYYMRIYDGKNESAGIGMLYNFIPCIQDSTSKVGFYDTVNDNFYSSTTGTEFVAPSNS